MSQGENSSNDCIPAELRARAEEILENQDAGLVEESCGEELLRQFQLQQIELKIQNEELRRSQQQLESTQERFIDLYYHAPVGYITIDQKGVIQELNFQAAELLGQQRLRVLETSLFNYLTTASRPNLSRHLEELRQDHGGICQCSLTISPGNNLLVHLKMLSISVEAGTTGGTPPQIRCAIFDATQERENEQRRESLQEQLRQAHRMEALGRMTSGIAHDFNNLLTLIIGYSKLLLNQLPEGDAFARHALQINKAGQHASELIEQLLAFSRTQTVSASPIHINNVISEMESMFDRLLGDDIELILHLDDALGVVTFDASQLQQVMMNLVVNAREAMPTGGTLIVRTRNIELHGARAIQTHLTPGYYASIEVQDSGRGIAADVLPHIFEPFFTTKRPSSTHGFGLATTRDILNHHNGTILVESSQERGTLFSIYLPRTDVERHHFREEPRKPCILLVDDQPALREFASLVLQDLDVEVLSACSAEDALLAARTHGAPIDLVVTDVIMPGLSGPQLFDQIKRDHPWSTALYMSGHDKEVLCDERGIAPDSPFLEKPFCPEKLSSMVRELLLERREAELAGE